MTNADLMNTPFFSIIIATYNQAETIQRTVQSVMAQSFQDFEVIIVNDGSKDNTEEIVSHLLQRDNFHYFHQPNLGVCIARNNGAAKASGKFFIFLDSDDFLSEGYLLSLYNYLLDSKYLICFGAATFFDTAGITIKKIQPFKSLEDFGPMLCGAYAISKDCFFQLKGFDSQLTYSENSDLFFRLREMIGIDEIGLVNNEGVFIQGTAIDTRSQKYSLKKYQSVKYFLEKHKSIFARSTREFLNFKRIEALCALQNGDAKEARNCIRQAIKRKPTAIKSYVQFFLLLFPRLATLYYFKSLPLRRLFSE